MGLRIKVENIEQGWTVMDGIVSEQGTFVGSDSSTGRIILAHCIGAGARYYIAFGQMNSHATKEQMYSLIDTADVTENLGPWSTAEIDVNLADGYPGVLSIQSVPEVELTLIETDEYITREFEDFRSNPL
jgi:hypothetical protein